MSRETITEIANFSNSFLFLFRDEVIFWLLQIFIVGILLYAIFRSLQQSHRRNKRRGAHVSVIRGEKSIGRLGYFATFFITAILAVVFSITETAQGYKVIIFLANVIIIFYLSFWNNWFRNKLISLYGKIKNKREG